MQLTCGDVLQSLTTAITSGDIDETSPFVIEDSTYRVTDAKMMAVEHHCETGEHRMVLHVTHFRILKI